MQNKFFLGLFLIFLAALFIFSNANITGNVIGFSNNIRIIGLVFFAAGMILVFTSSLTREREKLLKPGELEQELIETEPDAHKRAIIFDTSALGVYENAEQLARALRLFHSQGNRVYVPSAVINEEKSPEKRKALSSQSDSIKVNTEDMHKAAGLIAQTSKALLYKIAMPYFDGSKKLSSRREQEELGAQVSQIRAIMKKEGIDIVTANRAPHYVFQKIRDYLEKCKPSRADTEVIASAIAYARIGKHAIISEKDSHITEAVELLKSRYPSIGGHVDIIYAEKKS